MRFKFQTAASEIHPAILHAMNVVDRVWRSTTGSQAVCTALSEEGHSEGSRHYGVAGDTRCRAADFRSRDLTQKQRETIDTELKKRLGVPFEFDIVWEATHLHLEFDPK